MSKRFGVGFIGSGFIARFHIQSWLAVRDADILGVWSPNAKNAEDAAALCRKLDVGAARAYKSIADMVADPAIDAIWICGPNHKRVENLEEIVAALKGFEAAEAYLCGPGPFMTLVEQTLLKAGHPAARVLIERFEASGNDAVPVAPAADGQVVPDHITIHFEGKTHKVPYKQGQTILEAARLGGLNPLSSCEEGFCASCAAKRIKGEVKLAKNDIYTADDLANNWILTCQGHCFGPEVEITYDVV